MNAIRGKWAGMSWFRRILLLLMAAEILIFTAATAAAVSRPGLAFGDALLLPREEGDVTWYEGTADGQPAALSVAADGTAAYRWGEEVYGPYRVVRDPSAAPEGFRAEDGIEVRLGDEVLFRGCFLRDAGGIPLIDENGDPLWSLYASTYDGTPGAEDPSTPRARHEPELEELIRAVLAPELVHRGDMGFCLLTHLLTLLNMAQILFPEAMFRFSLWGHVRNREQAEPSDWYLFTTRLSWVIIAILCLVLYIGQLRDFF